MGNFFLFGLYFGENKAHFFLEHGETKSIALPVHSYYFSKAPARREKEEKEEGGGCVHLPLCCRRRSTGEDALQTGKMSIAGKRL